MTEIMHQIGFIGLGNMGAPLASLLLRAGYPIKVYNRTRSKLQPLLESGAQAALTPAEAATGSSILITMLADDQALAAVLEGEEGAYTTLAPGAVHVSMSTLSIAYVQNLATRHAESGWGYVAAPVFGRPQAAAEKLLWILAAGTPNAISLAKPVLETMGQGVIEVGAEPHLANVVKLGGNFMLGAMLQTLGDGLAFVEKHAIDPAWFLGTINDHLFRSPVYQNYGHLMVERRFEPAGFKLIHGLKDMRLVLAAAEQAYVPMPLASLVHDHFLSACAQGLGEEDWSALARLSRRAAGLAE
jgi:3-hydroxyisobutyrate dehydrogenase-like beta-hydroxyacid dehydrogenase